MPSPLASPAVKRTVADIGLWVAIGVVMAFLGPFGSSERNLYERFAYWLVCMVGGGLIGLAIDAPVRRRIQDFWLRLLAVSVLMTPPVMLVVALTNVGLAGMHLTFGNFWKPWFQVFIVCFAAMALRQLAGAQSAPVPERSEGDPAEGFRKRLSAKRREARLIAVEADDHYLRVHTDAGQELITARFADALDELAGTRGFRTHRSWWVAAEAIESVRWRRGGGELQLTCGLTVPVSRSNAAALKSAGWR